MDFYKNRILWTLILSGLIAVGLCQTIIESPVNTAVFIGDDARFNYSADLQGATDAVKWGFYVGGDSLETMYDSFNGIAPAYVGEIEVHDSSQYQYDLTILDAQPEDAGKYLAGFALHDEKVEPQLVVLSSLECSPNPPGGTTVVTGQEIQFLCSVAYYGYKKPTLEWQDGEGNYVDAFLEEDDTNTLILKANMTADWTYDLHDHTCHLNFELEEGETGPDPPALEHNCTTHYRVTYHSNQIAISPDPSGGPLQMYDGDRINCTANGNPQPTYNWYCNNGEIRPGSQLEVNGDLIRGDEMNICNCTALNRIGGLDHGTSLTISFYAYEDSSGGGDPGGVQAGVIAAAVIIPVVFIVVILVVGVYFMKKRKSNEKPKSSNGYSDPGKPKPTQPPAEQRPPPNVQPAQRTVNPQTAVYGAQTRQGYPGKGSPGYADLGVRGLSGSVPGLNQSQESLQDQQFYPNVNRNPSGSQV